MAKLGIPDSFSKLVFIVLNGASASVLLNDKATHSFSIQRGVRQGCRLSPYQFLLIEEALHMTVIEEKRQGNIKGIQLPDNSS